MKAAYRLDADRAVERPVADEGDLASAAGVVRSAFLGGLFWAIVLFVIFAG